MLGFYTGTMYNRWWRVRNIENEIMNGIHDMAIQVAGLVPARASGGADNGAKDNDDAAAAATAAKDTNANEEDMTPHEIRSTLVRWVNLGHAIAVGQLFELQPNAFTDLSNLVTMGLMTELELESMQQQGPGVCRYVPFVWAYDLVNALVAKSRLPQGALVVTNNSMSRIRGSMQTLQMYRSTPVPLAYRQLVNITVRFYMIILAFNEGIDALTFASEENQGFDYYRTIFWMTMPFAFEYFLFVGWLTIADALGNAFRDWTDALEWENYVRETCVASFSLIEHASTQPLDTRDLKKAEVSLKENRTATLSAWAESRMRPVEISLGKRPKQTSSKTHARKIMTGF